MNEISLSDRVEVAITALENIGDGTWNDLHPASERYSAAEKAKIIRDHTETVRKLSMWQEVIEAIPAADRDERINILDGLLERRVQEAASIIMSLSLVN